MGELTRMCQLGDRLGTSESFLRVLRASSLLGCVPESSFGSLRAENIFSVLGLVWNVSQHFPRVYWRILAGQVVQWLYQIRSKILELMS